MKEFSEKLKMLRLKKGLTQEELAKEIGVGVSAISMYEQGNRIPRDEIKIRLAKFFEESVEYIFFAN
ncbi:helix-turn-helix transcriptional regulator [Parvimonas sp. D9]|jgi:transcriptional regulator with XRE-family HTH domain|uniref:helix-turn-helix transcriptional regulator n=1 Tax=Parvimonas sp. D9 TaxID=3110689 RepID=UPI002B4A7052|nr:helix-turn-helix transcriptional regulator [Parvimonas sp. D9]MEB3059209.1 helix-turn-helix transcriptional regulator [Parvimonas sp. D9]